jgi:Prolyl oligopeptidase family
MKNVYKKEILFLGLLFQSSALHPAKWENTHSNVQTICLQGMASSQAQFSKYTKQLETTTGQVVSCPKKNRIDIILHPFIGQELSEVVPHSAQNRWFQKLMAGMYRYVQRNMYEYTFTPKSPDIDISGYYIDINKINVAQSNDIQEHAAKYALWKTQYGNNPYIALGISRGAAATFTSIALNQYDQLPALVILEGCFSCVPDVLNFRYGKAWKVASWLLHKFTQYDPNGPSPLSSIDHFPANVPVVFISSQADTSVPYACTKKLAYALAQKGGNDVYLITLATAGHTTYSITPKDRELYRNCLHAIYREYNLPFIKKHADAGEECMRISKISTIKI